MRKIPLEMLTLVELELLRSELIVQITEISNIDNRISLHAEVNAISKAINTRESVIRDSCGRSIGSISDIISINSHNTGKLKH